MYVVCPACSSAWYFLNWPTDRNGMSAYPGTKGIHTLSDMLAIVSKGPIKRE